MPPREPISRYAGDGSTEAGTKRTIPFVLAALRSHGECVPGITITLLVSWRETEYRL